MKRNMLFTLLFGAVSLWAAPRMQKKLQLPKIIYAVPGIECNLYFENIFLTINPSNFAFEVKCKKGRCDEKRWRYIPKDAEAGTYDLQVNVYDDDNLVATASSKLVVVPADAGKGKTVTLLLIGSSELEMQHAFPIHIHKLFQAQGNPALKMIGENGPGWPDKIGEVRHEGYGGWSFGRFITPGPGRCVVKRAYFRDNPFWNAKTKALDFEGYFQKNNGGKAPDFIQVSLGGNDVFKSVDGTIDADLAVIRKRMDVFLTALRKAAPDAKIALAEIEYCSRSQDAFGNNYGCLQSRWQIRKNFFKYRAMVRDVAATSGDPKLFAVPYYIALDNENNVRKQKDVANARNRCTVFRESNGLHPLEAGYQQCADCFYAWMKYQLSKP